MQIKIFNAGKAEHVRYYRQKESKEIKDFDKKEWER